MREAVFCCDYQRLFSLYEAAPNMGRALMDISYDKFRHAALTMAVRAYKPHVQVMIQLILAPSCARYYPSQYCISLLIITAWMELWSGGQASTYSL